MSVRLLTKAMLLAMFCAVSAIGGAAWAQQTTEVRLSYSKGQFQPSQVSAPADKPITLRVKNLDAKAMEFESKSLRVEKVVAPGSEGTINVRALKPGDYEFYDDFNETARGTLTVR